MEDYIGISLTMIGISLTILEIFLIILFFAMAYFGYNEIRGMKRKTQETIKETMQDEIKNFMGSQTGKRLLDKATGAKTPDDQRLDEKEGETK